MIMVRVKQCFVWGCIFSAVSKSPLRFQTKCTKCRSLKNLCIMAGPTKRFLSSCLPVFGCRSCFELIPVFVGSTETCASSLRVISNTIRQALFPFLWSYFVCCENCSQIFRKEYILCAVLVIFSENWLLFSVSDPHLLVAELCSIRR